MEKAAEERVFNMNKYKLISHAQYGLIKRQLKDGSQLYYVRFWNESGKRWFKTRSTGVPVTEPKEKAIEIAKEMLLEKN